MITMKKVAKKVLGAALIGAMAFIGAISPLGMPKTQAGFSFVSVTTDKLGAMYSNTHAIHSVNFRAQNAIPAGGSATITYPAGFDVSGATFGGGTAGASITSVAGQTVTVGFALPVPGASTVNLVLDGIDNAAMGNYKLTVTTKDGAGATIDGPSLSWGFQILGPVTKYTITEPAAVVAGQNFTVTVTALDANNYVTMGNSNVTLIANTADGVVGAGTLGVTSANTNNANGYQVIANQTYTKAETIRIRATDGTANDTGWTNINPAIDVTAAGLSSIKVTPANKTLTAGATQQYTAAGFDAYDNAVALGAVTWSETDTLGTITAGGKYTAKKVGTWQVKAKSAGITGTTNVTVTAGAVSSVKVNPDSAVLAQGKTKQYSATMTDAFGNTVTGHAVNWSVTNGLASITDAGLVKALYAGVTYVKATVDGKSDTARLIVTAVRDGGSVIGDITTPTVKPTVKPTTVGGKTTATPTKEDLQKLKEELEKQKQTTQSDNNKTIEKIVLTVIALLLLGASAYFLFRKSPETEEFEITKPEEIIKKSEKEEKHTEKKSKK